MRSSVPPDDTKADAHPTLLAALARGEEREAVAMGDGSMTYAELRAAVAAAAAQLPAGERVALWAAPSLATVVGLLGGLAAGAPLVPLNPKAGATELTHHLDDARPGAVIAPPGVALPPALDGLRRIDVLAAAADAPDVPLPAEPPGEAPAIIMYTSGTTGPPKGVVVSRTALAANLDALADAWEWTAADVLVHGLPLFHTHGLLLGVLGPLYLGGAVRHVGSFDVGRVVAALRDGATMLFGVPTMYRRLADAAEADGAVRDALAGARLLVSGSAALLPSDHDRVERLTGHRIVERYGMSETLIITAVRADGERRAGYVGLPLPGVEVRVVDDAGVEVPADDATIGGVLVRGPSCFAEYLNRPADTAEAFQDGWFATGDVATRSPDGYLRLVGRRSTDLINTGGYRVGAAEIEGALLAHPAVGEAAVLGLADPDLGERIVAWVVLRDGARADERELVDHVVATLTPHKRPREVRFLAALPRNAMGKVQKQLLD
ncbi:MAG TPA: AMP-binding protein [Conexibacter sp.]|nr:AMP-binding protein [Conexibacter sp.]